MIELEIRGKRRRRNLRGSSFEKVQTAPDEKHHNHHGCDLHDPQRLRARFVDTLDIRPPEIQRRNHTERRRELEWRNRTAGVHHLRYFVDHTSQILAGADDADRSRENVIENQSRYRKTRQEWSHGVAYDDINAAADIHAAAFQIDGTNCEAEQHDSEDEPGRTLAD